MKTIIDVRHLTFSYYIENREVPVLKNVSFSIDRGDFVAIQGPSGSGKSTLFYILGCMLRFKSGMVTLNGQDISHLTNSEMALLRNRQIGFIFQQFHLLPKASVLQNIVLPTHYPCEAHGSQSQVQQKAKDLAKRLGLENLLQNHPNQLSGGQQQRVAIARALMNDVDIILADEPTGNLDSKTSLEIMGLLKELNKLGKTVVLITHDSAVAAQCSKTLHIVDGVLVDESATKKMETSSREGLDRRAVHRPAPSLLRPWQNFMNIVGSVAPLSFDSLKRNKTRSVLTMLGVTIGIAAVLSMITFGEFTKKTILESYETLGVNKLNLSGYGNWNQKATDKTNVVFREFDWKKDILPLKEIFPETQLVAPAHHSWSTTLSFGGRSIDQIMAIGTTPEYLKIANREIKYGRNISPFQVEQSSPVCLIGVGVVEKLFLNRNPLGQIIFITDNDHNYPCQITGVLTSQKSNKDWFKPDLQVILPSTYFKNVSEQWSSELHHVSLQARAGTDMEIYSKKIKNFFNRRYGKAAEFWVDSDTVLIAQMKRFLTLFTIMLTSIAAVTLVVGGIGINNMMLVSVNERLREIGLLKAVGATDKSIRLQFLLEAVVLCTLAGVVGMILGFTAYEAIIWAAAKFVGKLSFQWVFDPLAFSASLIAIIVVGIASGVTPAMKAEKLEVIEALRSE